jgi:hypothetical protein
MAHDKWALYGECNNAIKILKEMLQGVLDEKSFPKRVKFAFKWNLLDKDSFNRFVARQVWKAALLPLFFKVKIYMRPLTLETVEEALKNFKEAR